MKLALFFSQLHKTNFMAQNNRDKKQTVQNTSDKTRRGDTDRTSNQGRKEASGGDKNTNNQGHPKEPKV